MPCSVEITLRTTVHLILKCALWKMFVGDYIHKTQSMPYWWVIWFTFTEVWCLVSTKKPTFQNFFSKLSPLPRKSDLLLTFAISVPFAKQVMSLPESCQTLREINCLQQRTPSEHWWLEMVRKTWEVWISLADYWTKSLWQKNETVCCCWCISSRIRASRFSGECRINVINITDVSVSTVSLLPISAL